MILKVVMFPISASGAGQQCCYQRSGDRALLVGPSGGGIWQQVSPSRNFWGHILKDVLPWYSCCIQRNLCDRVYQKRPSDDGSRYDPPRVGE